MILALAGLLISQLCGLWLIFWLSQELRRVEKRVDGLAAMIVSVATHTNSPLFDLAPEDGDVDGRESGAEGSSARSIRQESAEAFKPVTAQNQ